MNKYKVIEAYQKCVNKIDDFLEYRYAKVDKEEMRQFIYGQLDRLNIKLSSIREDKAK